MSLKTEEMPLRTASERWRITLRQGQGGLVYHSQTALIQRFIDPV